MSIIKRIMYLSVVVCTLTAAYMGYKYMSDKNPLGKCYKLSSTEDPNSFTASLVFMLQEESDTGYKFTLVNNKQPASIEDLLLFAMLSNTDTQLKKESFKDGTFVRTECPNK